MSIRAAIHPMPKNSGKTSNIQGSNSITNEDPKMED
jgi:hypothetical protein